eukprot:2131837-Rhodomonas_salina.1
MVSLSHHCHGQPEPSLSWCDRRLHPGRAALRLAPRECARNLKAAGVGPAHAVTPRDHWQRHPPLMMMIGGQERPSRDIPVTPSGTAQTRRDQRALSHTLRNQIQATALLCIGTRVECGTTAQP